ncbi:MAG: TRAP transporter small permease subunit [Oricola sp.]
MTGLMQIREWLLRRAENLLALLLLSMFIAFLLQIVFRYFLDLPVGWTVEWVTVAWLWGILFGYAFVVREADVIRFDVVYEIMPRGVRRAFDIIAGLSVAGIFLYTLPAAWNYVAFMHIERTAYMRWPFDWVFSIYIPFALAIIMRALMSVRTGLTGTGPRFHIKDSAQSHDYD